MVIFAGVIGAVTIVYSFFSYGQWTSMEKSTKEMRNNRELEYRAYVGVKGVLFQMRADNPAWGDVSVISVNTGRTLGRDGKIRAIVERRDASPPDNTVINEPPQAGSRILYVPSLNLMHQA